MKITKKQLRRIVKEAKLAEGMKEKEQELIEEIVNLLIEYGAIQDLGVTDPYIDAHKYLSTIMPVIREMGEEPGMWSDDQDYEAGFKR